MSMKSPDYIVETRNGNPAILVLQEKFTYRSFAHGNGEDSLEEILALVDSANQWNAL